MKYVLGFVKGIIFTVLGLLAIIGGGCVLDPDYAGYVKDLSRRAERFTDTGK